MFEIDVKGLAELEGGRPPERLAVEPIVNVFDEYRGYGEEGRKKPTFCHITLFRPSGLRKTWTLKVQDNGAGFARPEDIWTLFGTTGKRSSERTSGRFNAGDKQLFATARRAVVTTGNIQVTFEDGERKVYRPVSPFPLTEVAADMPWTVVEGEAVLNWLSNLEPPTGLEYCVNEQEIKPSSVRHIAIATLPTVVLDSSLGVMRRTERKTEIGVLHSRDNGLGPWLYELGIPVCSLADVGFRWSLDVQQKIPLPLSRDVVSPAYLYQVIGKVLEHAAMDGVTLLTEEEQGAGFIKDALSWVREPEALKKVVQDVYGENAVRQSSDPLANAQAAMAGATVIPGRTFAADTRERFDKFNIMRTSKDVFGGTVLPGPAGGSWVRCSECGGTGRVKE
jgi:hypothetical protein